MPNTVLGTHGSGDHAGRPAGNAVPDGSLYSCTDHDLIYVSDYAGNSWSTWADLTGTGMSDPMTTRGDIIVRNASNATDRLAIGAANTVLSSDGTDVSWAVPKPANYQADASGDTATLTADTETDMPGCTFTPAAGNYIIGGVATSSSGTATYILGVITFGASNTHFSMGRGVRATGTPISIPIPARKITMNGTDAVKLRVQAGLSSGTFLRYGTGTTPSTAIWAIRVA